MKVPVQIMYTEDDTFRKLKRIPFSQLERIVRDWVYNHNDIREIEEVLHDNGWTREAYDNYLFV